MTGAVFQRCPHLRSSVRSPRNPARNRGGLVRARSVRSNGRGETTQPGSEKEKGAGSGTGAATARVWSAEKYSTLMALASKYSRIGARGFAP